MKEKQEVYNNFEEFFSPLRMSRYQQASSDIEDAIELYSFNLRASQEMFGLIHCFEVILRNKIDTHYKQKFGDDWIKDSISVNSNFAKIEKHVSFVKTGIGDHGYKGHNRLLVSLTFSFWTELFNTKQHQAGGDSLLKIFTKKPRGSEYNNLYVYTKLKDIKDIRNRIAHHEPICFNKENKQDFTLVNKNYNSIIELLKWLDIDPKFLIQHLKMSGMLYHIYNYNHLFEKL